MSAEDAVAQVLGIPERATAAACFGTPVTAGERTVIPVADIQYGFGAGWGAGWGTSETNPTHSGGRGGGAGGGARTRAIAVIEITPQGVRVLPIEDHTSIRIAGITFSSAATAIVSRTLLKLIRG